MGQKRYENTAIWCYVVAGQQVTGFQEKVLASHKYHMRFKQWLEDTTSSGDEFGNTEHPEEHGLKRQNRLRRPVPHSAKADKLFGYLFFGKN